MIDKKVLKFYIIALIVSSLPIIATIVMGGSDTYDQLDLYNTPFGTNARQVQAIYMIIAVVVPYLAIFIGYALAYVIVRIYCKLTKYSKRIEFVGYARIDRSGTYLRKRYLTHIIIATLLCINIWIILVSNGELMKFFLSEEGKEKMYVKETGQMLNFPMVIWYWLPVFIASIVFAMCAVIQDSGLVSITKLSGQSEFADTERVGDRFFAIVKGYAGIAVIINFYLLLTTPLGQEGSLVIYPILALVLMGHAIVAIDMFRNVGIKWIHKAVRSSYPPQLIELSYNKIDIDPKELIT